MREQHKETLSALFDGEAEELEMRRLLSNMDEQNMAQWQRFQFVSDAMKNRLGDCHLNVSIVDKVAAQIALEPDFAKASGLGKSDKTKDATSNKGAWLKPLLGFATAASVAFVTVLGVQQLKQPVIDQESGFVANGNVSASQLPISSNPGFNMVSGAVQTSSLQNEIEIIEAQKKRNEERLKYYMQLHAEQATFNNGSGLLPMARISGEEN